MSTAPADERPLRVAELARLLKGAVEALGPRLRVEGEVRTVREASSGHVYFTLKDEEAEATIDAVLFRTCPPSTRAVVREGARVVVTCRATVFTARGKLQIEVERAELSGRGSLLEALEERRKKLAAEGLFARERKRPLPREARVVGVVTSGDGAAIHDIVQVAFRRGPVRILLARSPVQGGAAAARMVRALELLARARVDAVILGRGGGSGEDLSAFDDEALARKIAAMPMPVVSAVGHETDVTIADLVADARAATPSEAAELLVPDAREKRSYFTQVGRRIVRGTRQALALARSRTETLAAELRGRADFARENAQRIDELEASLEAGMARGLRARRADLGEIDRRLAARHPRSVLDRERAELGRLEARLATGARRGLDARRLGHARLAARLEALSPLEVLARGYAIAATPDGRVVRRASEVAPGDELRVRLAEGKVGVRVTETEPLPGEEPERHG